MYNLSPATRTSCVQSLDSSTGVFFNNTAVGNMAGLYSFCTRLLHSFYKPPSIISPLFFGSSSHYPHSLLLKLLINIRKG